MYSLPDIRTVYCAKSSKVAMGYTGAVFQSFFGTTYGFIITILVMLLWIAIPVSLSLRKFERKDL